MEPLELAWQAGTAPDNLSAVCCLTRPVPSRPHATHGIQVFGLYYLECNGKMVVELL